MQDGAFTHEKFIRSLQNSWRRFWENLYKTRYSEIFLKTGSKKKIFIRT